MNHSHRFRVSTALAAVAATAAICAADMSFDQATLKSDGAEFSLGAGNHHFWDRVEFRYPGMLDLDCADLRILLIPGGQKIDRLIASNDVVMTLVQRGTNAAGLPGNRSSGTNRIHAAVAEYTATNDTVTLTGSPAFGQPWVEGVEGSFRADVITFDRLRDKIGARGNFKMIIRPDALPKGALDPARASAKPPASSQ